MMATQKPPSSPRWVRFQPSQWVSLTPAPTDIRRLKALEAENAKLKRLLAERALEIDVMREVNRKKW